MEILGNKASRIGFRSAFLCGAATIGLVSAAAPAAYAQDGLETVVVTGTAIRGTAPIGSNVIGVNAETLAQTGGVTVTQMLAGIPAISGFGASSPPSQGDYGIESQPNIHQLGASSSNSTLVLMNGRPILPQGSIGASDPSIIPTIAIQRVDVMPDGDSAIYGSSAVAGVVNFITRKHFDGVQANATFGRAQGLQRSNFGLLAGADWTSGSVTGAYEYKSNSSLFASDRSYTASANLTDRGGANFGTNSCFPANIAATSATTSNLYAYPYNGATIGTPAAITAANKQPCDNSGMAEYLPSNTTNTFYLDVDQDVGNIKVDFNAGFEYRAGQNKGPATAVNATAFGPTGSSAAEGTLSRNPFYVGNAATGTSSEFVYFDPTQMFGVVRTAKAGALNVYDNLSVTFPVFGEWEGVVDQTAGYNEDYTSTNNGFCSACALLAINGTTNATGAANNSVTSSAIVSPFGFPTITSVTQALNTADALDVWNPQASNRTSPAVIKSIFSDQTQSVFRDSFNDVKLHFDGPLFGLPAGDLKAAFGAEFSQTNFQTNNSGSNAAGSSLVNGTNLNQTLPQTVRSIFLEFNVPVISPDMNIPLIQQLDFQVAGRVDGYSTTGWTHNPKLGLSWQIADGLKARASYGTSFTAPNVTFVSGINTVGPSTANFTIPNTHPNYPGSFCTGPGAPNPCNVSATLPGISLSGPNKNLLPMTGNNYSAGLDINAGKLWAPLSGLVTSITYWNVRFNNALTLVSSSGSGYLTTPGLYQYLQIAPPGGWTQTSPVIVNAVQSGRVTGALPPTIYYISNQVRVNGFSIDADGLDLDANYVYSTNSWGDFSWGYDTSWKLDWRFKGGPVSTPGDYVSYSNGRFNTSILHEVQYAHRMSVGWTLDPLDVSFFWNYINPYWNQTSTGSFSGCSATTQAACPTGYPSGFPTALYNGGFERIRPTNTFDLNLNYHLSADWMYGWTKGTTLTFNIKNILNSRPPFINGGGGCNALTCNGVDEINGDPLDRILTFSIRKTF